MTKVWMKATNEEVFETSNPEWHTDSKRLTQKEGVKARQVYCRSQLRKMLKPGQQVYCVLRHVSTSGMTRDISLFIVQGKTKDGPAGLRCIDSLAADCVGYRRNPNGQGIRIGGCGMDMGFQLVYSLGASVWPTGTPKPHGKRNGEPDSEGGYALKHEWL